MVIHPRHRSLKPRHEVVPGLHANGSSRPPRILGCRCSVSSRPVVHGTLRRQKHQKIATTRPTKNFQFPGEAPLRLNPSRNPCRSRAEGATLRAPPFSMKPGDESRAPDVQVSLKRGGGEGLHKTWKFVFRGKGKSLNRNLQTKLLQAIRQIWSFQNSDAP